MKYKLLALVVISCVGVTLLLTMLGGRKHQPNISDLNSSPTGDTATISNIKNKIFLKRDVENTDTQLSTEGQHGDVNEVKTLLERYRTDVLKSFDGYYETNLESPLSSYESFGFRQILFQKDRDSSASVFIGSDLAIDPEITLANFKLKNSPLREKKENRTAQQTETKDSKSSTSRTWIDSFCHLRDSFRAKSARSDMLVVYTTCNHLNMTIMSLKYLEKALGNL